MMLRRGHSCLPRRLSSRRLRPSRNFVTYRNVEMNLATAGMTARYTKPLSF